MARNIFTFFADHAEVDQSEFSGLEGDFFWERGKKHYTLYNAEEFEGNGLVVEDEASGEVKAYRFSGDFGLVVDRLCV